MSKINDAFDGSVKRIYVCNNTVSVNSEKTKNIHGAHLQKIYYGAPGTGKSNEIKRLTGEGEDGIKFSKDFTFRTTFHPDSDY